MMNKNIVIIGGGFGGLAAYDYLIRNDNQLPEGYKIILVDQKKTFDYLPMVPDVLAGWLEPQHAVVDLAGYVKKRRGEFILGSLEEIDQDNKKLKIEGRWLDYEQLIIAAGGEVNYYGLEQAKEHCLPLNSVQGALSIQEALRRKCRHHLPPEVVVVGGGYTGVETALSIHYLARENQQAVRITIIEKTPQILSGLPDSIRQQAEKELDKRSIPILTEETLQTCTDDVVVTSSGRTFDNALCIWSAGVRAPLCLSCLQGEKASSRVKVNETLQPVGDYPSNIFIIGDCAAFTALDSEYPLRMSIMFALEEGKIAAENILRSLAGKDLKKYNPVDLGYLIPLVYHKAPGKVLGFKVPGWLGYLLHYLLCLYRAKAENIPGILKDLIVGRILHKKGVKIKDEERG
ncbi:MAG: NAD(P)/FAD-dependent oxidoreductase [Chlamydiota bacterium]